MSKIIWVFFFINLSLFFSGVSFAQVTSNEVPAPVEFPENTFTDFFAPEYTIDEELLDQAVEFFEANYPAEDQNTLQASASVSCFDHYTFGSIQANIKTNVPSTVPGIAVPFFGDIKNENPYPIVNGTLYVKIFRVNSDASQNYNGPDVVDQFIVKRDLNLKANESQAVEFEWKVPAFAKSGKYQVATFFVANHKYNLLGLSFTDDVVGNTAEFDVVDGQNIGVYFDKNSVTINDAPYFFAAYPPRVDSQKPTVIKATVVNSTNETVTVPVLFKTFYWDAMHQGNSLQEKEEWVSVPAKSTKEVSFSVSDKKYPVYLSEIVLKYKDAKSILNPRFVLSGADRLRINFPAVKQYPLIKNEEVELFACFHNTANSVVSGKLLLQILDEDNNLIHEHEFSGNISGDMMATLDKFVPKSNYSTFTIKAFLYQGDMLVDEDTVYYKCEEFDMCNSFGGSDSALMDFIKNNILIVGIAVIAVIIVLILFGFLIRSKSKSQKLIIFLLIFSPAFLWDVNKAQAESVVWTLSDPAFVFSNTTSLANGGNVSEIARGAITAAIKNVTATVKYSTRVLNVNTGEVIACGSSVPAGTRLKFEFVPHQNEDVSWFGTGSAYDSPYGSWKSGGGAPADLCVEKNYLMEENTAFGGLVKIYTDLSVNPPNKAISGLPTNCTTAGSDKDCVMDVLGDYKALFQFSSTYGLFHYGLSNTGGVGYRTFGALAAGSCRKSLAPLLVTKASNSNLVGAWNMLNVASIKIDLPIKFGWRYDYTGGPVWLDFQKPAYDVLMSEWSKVSSHLVVPAQEISCPITVGPDAQIPGLFLQSPTVTRKACISNSVGNEIPYTFKSLNAGKRIRFLIDWNNDGSVDQILPPNGYTTASSVSTNRVWSNSGEQTFNVLVQDNEGSSSSKVVFTSKSDCNVLDLPDTEINIETSTVKPPGRLFEGGIRQVFTNRKCTLDISGVNNSSTCVVTKDKGNPVNMDVSSGLELEPGKYYISCTQFNGQVLASEFVCLLSPEVREI